MAIDIFNRVSVNLSISVPPTLDNSVHNTAMVTNTALPGAVPYKLYQNIKDFVVDFPEGTAPQAFAWGNAFYAENASGNLFAIYTELPTTDSSVVISTAVLNALNLIKENAEINEPLSFYTVSFDDADELFYSDDQVVAELQNFEAAGIELFIIGQTYSDTMFNSLSTFAPAAYLQSTQLSSIGVMIIGYPELVADEVIPKVSASCAGFLSLIDVNQGAQNDLDGQQFPAVTPLKVGSTDVYGTLFNTTKVNQLVSQQVNMYTRYANQTQFAFGLVMAPENIPTLYYYIRQLLKVDLQNTLSQLFFNNTALPYNVETVARVHALIDGVLKEFVAAEMIDPGYIIIDPVLDFTTPIPRSLAWGIQGQLAGRLYAITVGGNLQG